ncbi:putative disease resistance protein At1g50180 [Bidens hawaiensis]|uniref:putative disease resistance protein At1g50180 n=1 Tax=Bidens hawaiensis TaxID=980011 RepID=UPI0040491D00
MAVEAVVSVVIHTLTNLLTFEESKTFEAVRDEALKVLKELSRLNDAQQDQSNYELQFLGNVYRMGDAVESFSLSETYLRRGFVKKRGLLTGNEFKLCRDVAHELGYSVNISRLKSEMNRIIKEVQIWKDGNHGNASVQEQQQESGAFYAPKNEYIIFKKDVNKLMMLLISNRKVLQIISVFGDVGIGKAAHVKAVYGKLKDKFQCSALVVMDPNWSVSHLMMAILQKVGLKVEEELKDDVLRGKLHGFLKTKKYLIVISDINRRELLEDLRRALPDAYSGSRVVITTSNKEAASFADASNRYHLNYLEKEEGLNFFISKTRGRERIPFASDQDMEYLKNIIVESCHGTLVGIALLAGLLSTKGEIYEEWSKVFKQLEVATKSPSFDVLIFCYNDVPMHLKPCLLYLTLFRKESEIPVRRLYRLWLAEGFVKPSRRTIPEDIVEEYLEELVKRNMVEITKWRSDESIKKCRLIGALHDILLPVALEIGLFHLHQKSDEHSSATEEHRFGIRRVVEYTNIKNCFNIKDFKNIHSFISFNGRKKDIPAEEMRTFLKSITQGRGFGFLRVLDLEGVYRPRLPSNLGNLFHLRYLGLRWTFLDTLPSSLGGLLYLETLDIKHTRITTLPSSIWNMKHLHHLCLNGERLDISEQSAIHRGPSQLQTLWGLFVDEKIARKIGSTLMRMTNLRKLDITRQSSSTITTTTATTTTNTTSTTTTTYDLFGSWILSLVSLQSLRLRSKDKMGQPSVLIIKPLSRLENLSQLYLLGHLRESLSWYQIPPGLNVLTLSVSRLGEDPMPTLSRLPILMVLRLLAASYVGEEMHCPKNGFPSLRVLKLWKLEELKLLTVDEGAMQNLQTMEIRCCTNLKKLPLSLLSVESFENLILTNMPKEFVSAARSVTLKHTEIVENDF